MERNGVWVEDQGQASHVVMDHAGSLVKRAVVVGAGTKQVGWCRSRWVGAEASEKGAERVVVILFGNRWWWAVGMGIARRADEGWGAGTYRVPNFDEVINIDHSALQIVADQVGLLGLLLRLLGSSNGHGLRDGRGQLLLLDFLGASHCCGGFGGLAGWQLSWLRAAAGGLQSGGLVVNGKCWRGGVVGQVQGAAGVVSLV